MRISLEQITDRVSFLDPASSKTPIKAVRARQAIVTVGADLHARIFCLETWCGRVSTERLYEQLFETHQRWHPGFFGIEANAMQSFLGDAVALEAKYRGIRFPLVPVNQPTKVDKYWRIRTILQPVIGWGRLFVPDSQLELKKELVSFPHGQTVDLVDALASAIALLPARPRHQIRQGSERALAAYLRESGVSQDAIEQRLEEYRGNRRPSPPLVDMSGRSLYTAR